MVWRVCERFSILPPGVSNKYDDLTPWAKAKLLAYEQIRQYEDTMEPQL